MKQSSSKSGDTKKQSQAGVQINSNLGSGRPPASKGSEGGASGQSKKKGSSSSMLGQGRGHQPQKNSIASEKVGKSSADHRAGHDRIPSGQSNGRRSAGAKPSGEQPPQARTTDQNSPTGESKGSNKYPSGGDRPFDIQMDQLHVVEQSQLTGDRTMNSGARSPADINAQ